MFELVLGFFPGWIAIIGISLALTLPVVQSCRHWVRERAGQAPPPNVGEHNAP
jgi:hypothetical protein